MSIAIVLLTSAVVIIFALLAAVGTGTLARLDGATYPAAITRAAVAFGSVLTLSATLTAVLMQVLT